VEVDEDEARGVTGDERQRGGLIGMKCCTGAGWWKCCEGAQAAKGDENDLIRKEKLSIAESVIESLRVDV
jgi:hypothetical protein